MQIASVMLVNYKSFSNDLHGIKAMIKLRGDASTETPTTEILRETCGREYAVLDASSAGDQINDKYYHRDDEQYVDKRSDTGAPHTESECPQNQ
jgi:hypothetical protein